MISVIPPMDAAVAGGSLAAVSAALELKRSGRSVLLLTHRTYLGEDICDSLRLKLPEDLDISEPLAERLFGDAVQKNELLRPMHLKRELDRVLLEAEIPVMLGTAVGEILVDEEGLLSGLTLCNRSGRHFLPCRTVIDGSLRGDLARLAELPLTAPSEGFEVIRRVIGGEAEANREWQPEGEVSFEANGERKTARLWAHRSTASLPDGSWASWMKLEQDTRMQAYRPGQDISADGIFAFTGERLHPGQAPASTNGDFSAVTPQAVSGLEQRLWFTGPVANVDTPTRNRLLRPDGAIAWGRTLAQSINLLPYGQPSRKSLRSLSTQTLPDSIEARDLPLVVSEDSRVSESAPSVGYSNTMEVDVLVVGGGTGGAPAAIAAARQGKRTLVAEFLSGLGGVGTLGMIGKYWFGNRVGFTAEIDEGAASRTPRTFESGQWDIEAKMQWYHESVTQAGGHVWYKTMTCGALREGNRVVGAILATPQGRIAVKAQCVIDATGSADVAAAAGAETVGIGHGHLAVQGTGLPSRTPGANYGNTDYDFIDDSNASDVSSAHITARQKFKTAFDAGQLVDSRERRRVVGDYEVTPMDIRLARVFPDTIVKARSNFDTHGFTVHPLFMIVPPDHEAKIAYVPLRTLLPRGLDGILVTGLGISAHRDAMPVIRMQADVQNQGYAAGVIAATTPGGKVRSVDIDAVQAHLVETGVLAPEIRGAADSFPLEDTAIDQALEASVDDLEQIDRVFTLDDETRNARIHTAFEQATTEKARRHFAFVLGILYDATGAEILAEEIVDTPWDEGWDYRGMGQFGASMSPLDGRIIALGRCRDSNYLPVLRAKAEALPSDAAFSHFRALAESIETIGDPSGEKPLEQLLQRPGLTGHHVTNTEARLATATDSHTETRFRNAALIELHVATATYRLNPENALAKEILENYRHDLRGLFAKHAASVLQTTQPAFAK